MNSKASVIGRINSVNWARQYEDLFKKAGTFNRQKAQRHRTGMEAFIEAMLNGELCLED